MLRSFAFGEADRVLHVYSLASGRIGAVAKGVRRTKSRFGGRLEPFSHVELSIHRGRGELGTVTGASLVRSHDAIRIDPYRLQVGLVGLEAMLRLYTDEERNDRAFLALTRFLDALDSQAPQPSREACSRPARPLVPAEAALARGLPAASWTTAWNAVRSKGIVAFLAVGRRCGVHGVDHGGIGLSPDGTRRACGRSSAHRSRTLRRSGSTIAVPRRARGRDVVVRAPRRLPPANAVRIARRRVPGGCRAPTCL